MCALDMLSICSPVNIEAPVVVKPETVAPTAKFLLATMALFFVPFGVGLIESYGVISQHWIAITIAAVISTLAVIAVTAFVYIKLRK